MKKITTSAKFVPIIRLSGLLLVLVIVSFGSDFIGDEPGPGYVTAGYHLLIIPVFIFAFWFKRFGGSFVFTLFYLGTHIYSLWVRTQGCFLGDDLCPPVPVVTKLLDRTVWIDGVASVGLPILLVLQLVILFRYSRRMD